MPVAYSTKENPRALSGFFIGWTVNVHQQGICVRARANQMPSKGSCLTLLVTSSANDRLTNADVSVQMKGEVVWVDHRAEAFGISLLNGD